MRRHFGSVVVLLALSASSGQAQSLADVAKQEEARRRAVTSTGKVYTNDNLRPDSAPAVASPPAAAPSTVDKATGDTSTTPAASGQDSKSTGEKKDEKYWRSRLTQERDALTRAQAFAEALQSRINALTADFANRDDPAQRNQVGADRQKALSELDRVRKEIAEHTKGIADIQEEGRKAAVPAAWLR